MQKGFTVLELLVVIAIIGILSSIILVSYNGYTDKAKIAKTLQWAKSVEHSIGDQVVGVWTFDNITGATVYDDSGNNNNGVITGALQVDGVIGKGLNFNAYSHYVSIPHSDILNNVFGTGKTFTLSAWAYPRAWVSYSTIMNKATAGSWSNATAGLWSYGSGFRCVMGSGVDGNPAGSSIGVEYKPTLNTWHHIACVADGTYLKMYVDSVYRGQVAIASLTYPRSANAAPLVFGRRSAGTGESFPGVMDSIRIFSAALTQAQIQQHYADGLKTHQNLTVK